MNTITTTNPTAFPLGACVVTRSVNEAMSDDRFRAFVMNCIARHASGDWGDIDIEDRTFNDQALRDGERLLSAYDVPPPSPGPDGNVWIITERDRSVTTVLWPSDY